MLLLLLKLKITTSSMNNNVPSIEGRPLFVRRASSEKVGTYTDVFTQQSARWLNLKLAT